MLFVVSSRKISNVFYSMFVRDPLLTTNKLQVRDGFRLHGNDRDAGNNSEVVSYTFNDASNIFLLGRGQRSHLILIDAKFYLCSI